MRRHRTGSARIRLAAVLPALALALGAGCGGDPTGAAPVEGVVIEPAAPVVALAETIQLSATPLDGAGQPLAGRAVVWATADPSVATIDEAGTVTPLAAGRVQLAASAEGRSAVVELQVLPRRVRTVVVAASASRAEVGDTVVVAVVPRGVDGVELAGRPVAYSSTAPAVATVDEQGRAVAQGPGEAEIVADVEGVTGSVAITVAAPSPATIVLAPAEAELIVGRTVRLDATVRDRLGRTMAGQTVAYASSAPDVASVDADGTVRGQQPGEATITAAAGSAGATARVRVVPVPAARLTVAPSTATLDPGQTLAVSATLRDAAGNVLTGRAVAWSSTVAGVAQVSPAGVITAVAPGNAVVRASAEGLTADVQVKVNPVPVHRVAVTPADFTLQPAQTRQLTVETSDASGAPLGGRTIAWSSTAPGVATVSPTGLVTAVAPGTATLRATVDGVIGSARITVVAPPPPPPPSPPGPPARLEIVSGDGQTNDRRDQLAQPLVVRVVDAHGRPVAGVFVLWLASHGGDTSPTLSITGADGRSSTRWTLGGRRGEQTVSVSSLGVPSVTFRAEAR